jgi:hypothetical protein
MSLKPISLSPNQWELKLGADEVQIRLDLPLAERKFIGKLSASLARFLCNVFHNPPDSANAVCDQVLPRHFHLTFSVRFRSRNSAPIIRAEHYTIV